MLVFLYCIYGEEMIRERLGPAKVFCPAILENYDVVFHDQDYHEKGSTANAVAHEGKQVLGIVYDLNCEQVALLDAWMGTHYGLRKRRPVHVVDPAERTWKTETYFHTSGGASTMCPSEDYLRKHQSLVFTAWDMFRQSKGLDLEPTDFIQGMPRRLSPHAERKKRRRHRKRSCQRCPSLHTMRIPDL